jgi:hypothetical protein
MPTRFWGKPVLEGAKNSTKTGLAVRQPIALSKLPGVAKMPICAAEPHQCDVDNRVL